MIDKQTLDRAFDERFAPEIKAKLQAARVAVAGLGGLGSNISVMLARSGIGHLKLVDFDKVDATNLNRQILYTAKDVGRNKVDAAKDRILAINPEAEIQPVFAKAQDFDSNQPIDFLVDAIDDVDGKLFLLRLAQEKDIPHIMSLGMANRFDNEKVHITKLNKTHSDPLAKKVRYLVKKSGLEIGNVNVVISEELPQKNAEKLYSTMMVPSSAGLCIAKYILSSIIDNN